MVMAGEDVESTFNFEAVTPGLLRPNIVQRGVKVPNRKRYLIVFKHRYLNFRLAEAQALAETAHGKRTWDEGSGNCIADDGMPVVTWELPQGNVTASPFWYIHLPSEKEAAYIRKRSMLVRCIIDVWGEGEMWEDVYRLVLHHDPEERTYYRSETQSFKFVVESWGKSMSQEDKVNIIESFEPSTGFRGPIRLKDAMHSWWVIVVEEQNQSMLPDIPEWKYFGREVGKVEQEVPRLPKYDLSKRRYIGPTSMDPELSFIMSAVGCIKEYSLVLDPFVGTGSILIAAADAGAITLGTDIDIRVIKHGKRDQSGREVNVWTNFFDYELIPPVGILRADLHTLPFRDGLEEVLDAILADPPYGVRAGGRKSQAITDIHIKDRETHIPSTAPYTLAECLQDLVKLAARLLIVGGSLVFWIPAAPGFYKESELPSHPVLEYIANCEQLLSGRYSRRLLVMTKVKQFHAAAEESHYKAKGSPRMALDELRDHVYASKNPKNDHSQSGSSSENQTKMVYRRLRNKLV